MQQNNGLDKKNIISFVLFTLVIFGVMMYFQNKDLEKNPVPNKEVQKIEPQKANLSPSANLASTDLKMANLQNQDLKLQFSSLGGQLSKVELLKYNAYSSGKKDKKVNLIDKNSATYGFQFKDKSGKIISTKDLNFNPVLSGTTLSLTANYNTAVIQFIYTLLPNYQLDFKVKTQGLSLVANTSEVDFVWDYNIRQMEKGRDQEITHSEFCYSFNNYENYDYDGRTTMEESEETLNWIGVKQQFFTSVIESKTGFSHSKGNQETLTSGEFLKKLNFQGQLKNTNTEFNQDFSWYFMPLDQEILGSYNKNFDEILPLGWSFIGWLNRVFFIPLFHFISSFHVSAGWAIFLLTLIVKIILLPIMYKQHKLSAMMKIIKPEVEEAHAKLKDADALKKQQATQEVYRKAGVNQFAGCIPGLLQIPIFYALFRFFPNMLELRGKSFWFAQDLTAYDDIIKLPFSIPMLGEHLSVFALACTVVLLIYTIMTQSGMQQPTQEGMPNMKVLMYIFPITFLFFLNSAASGLSWYYFASNAMNILIILAIKYLILDEKKIHAMIQSNKAKPPKKVGKFRQRMNDMMEQAQEQQKNKKK